MKNCIVIVGKIASGKSTIAREIARALNYEFIEVSDIVRELTGRERDTIRLNDLTGTVIAAELRKELDLTGDYVISGPRQVEILAELSVHFKMYFIKIDVSEAERARRAMEREGSTREQVRAGDELDAQLGFDKVLKVRGYTIRGSKSLQENIDTILSYLAPKE